VIWLVSDIEHTPEQALVDLNLKCASKVSQIVFGDGSRATSPTIVDANISQTGGGVNNPSFQRNDCTLKHRLSNHEINLEYGYASPAMLSNKMISENGEINEKIDSKK